MRKTLVVAIVLAGFCFSFWQGSVHAQLSTAAYVVQVQAGTTIANCPVVAGQTQFCYVATGAFWSQNGGAYTAMLTPPIGTPVFTVNNKKPDATGNVALAATTSLQ